MNIKNENKPVGGDEGDNASGSGGPGWPEACRREETIRKLLGRSEGERLKMGDVEEVALEVGVSRATLYRLITAYRQTPTVEALRRTRCGCSRREKRFLNLNVRGREPLSKFSNKMSNALANREFLTIRCIPTRRVLSAKSRGSQ